jgi:DNA-binding NarL/FixJ family response regulator
VNKIKILSADNQTLARECVRRILEVEEDYEVVGEANIGEQTVKLTGSRKLDIAIVGFEIPNMNVINLIGKLIAD